MPVGTPTRSFSSSGPRGRGKPGPRGAGKAGGGKRPRRPFMRRKVCRFCADRVQHIDYKEYETLRRFLTEKGKIIPRRTTGNCAKCQRRLVRAINRARHAGFLAFQAA